MAFQSTSGRKCSHRTTPPVTLSIAGQCSAGTFPRFFHMLGRLGDTPMRSASWEMVPTSLIARSSASMGLVLVLTNVITPPTPT